MKFSVSSFFDIKRKLTLYLTRLRCKVCYKNVSSAVSVALFDRMYTNKKFSIYDKRPSGVPYRIVGKYIINDRDLDERTFFLERETLSLRKPTQLGRLIEVELICDNCGQTRSYEFDIDRLSGNNLSR